MCVCVCVCCVLDSVFTGVMYVWTYTTEGEEVALDKG